MSHLSTDNVLFVVITIWLFPHSSLITWLVTRVTRLVPLVEKELLNVEPSGAPEFTPFICGVWVAQSLVVCVLLWRPLFFSCCPFRLTLVMSVLRFTVSDYPRESLNFSTIMITNISEGRRRLRMRWYSSGIVSHPKSKVFGACTPHRITALYHFSQKLYDTIKIACLQWWPNHINVRVVSML